MNLLPLVFSFLLVAIAFTATTRTSLFFTKKSLAHITVLNQLEIKRRSEISQKAIPSKKKQNTPPKGKDQREKKKQVEKSSQDGVYFRSQKPIRDSQKLNIHSIYTSPVVQEACATLLKNLYGKKEFWKKGLEHQIVGAIVNSKTKQWHDWVEEKDSIYPILYKIMRGTNQYQLEGGEGVAPLSDFVCFVEEPCMISFPYVHQEVLRAVFPEEIVAALSREEMVNGNKALKRSDFFQKHPNSMIESITKGNSFFEKKEERTVSEQDVALALRLKTTL